MVIYDPLRLSCFCCWDPQLRLQENFVLSLQFIPKPLSTFRRPQLGSCCRTNDAWANSICKHFFPVRSHGHHYTLQKAVELFHSTAVESHGHLNAPSPGEAFLVRSPRLQTSKPYPFSRYVGGLKSSTNRAPVHTLQSGIVDWIRTIQHRVDLP